MKEKDFILQTLEELKKPIGLKPLKGEELEKELFNIITSSKFRKLPADAELKVNIKSAIAHSVANNLPITFLCLHGAFKLWRLEESPEADWAELFNQMYYTEILKPICEIYKYGVIMDYYVDDLIMPPLNNYTMQEVEAFLKSYQGIMNFLKPYQSKNCKMQITTVSSVFGGEKAMWDAVNKKLETTPEAKDIVLNAEDKYRIQVNVRLTEEQEKDPLWMEKVNRLFLAYMSAKREQGYYKGRTDKILTNPHRLSGYLAIGTTANSLMKFWIAMGVLFKKGKDFSPMIVNPKQLEEFKVTKKAIKIDGLNGKNFSSIRIVERKEPELKSQQQ